MFFLSLLLSEEKSEAPLLSHVSSFLLTVQFPCDINTITVTLSSNMHLRGVDGARIQLNGYIEECDA